MHVFESFSTEQFGFLARGGVFGSLETQKKKNNEDKNVSLDGIAEQVKLLSWNWSRIKHTGFKYAISQCWLNPLAC